MDTPLHDRSARPAKRSLLSPHPRNIRPPTVGPKMEPALKKCRLANQDAPLLLQTKINHVADDVADACKGAGALAPDCTADAVQAARPSRRPPSSMSPASSTSPAYRSAFTSGADLLDCLSASTASSVGSGSGSVSSVDSTGMDREDQAVPATGCAAVAAIRQDVHDMRCVDPSTDGAAGLQTAPLMQPVLQREPSAPLVQWASTHLDAASLRQAYGALTLVHPQPAHDQQQLAHPAPATFPQSTRRKPAPVKFTFCEADVRQSLGKHQFDFTCRAEWYRGRDTLADLMDCDG